MAFFTATATRQRTPFQFSTQSTPSQRSSKGEVCSQDFRLKKASRRRCSLGGRPLRTTSQPRPPRSSLRWASTYRSTLNQRTVHGSTEDRRQAALLHVTTYLLLLVIAAHQQTDSVDRWTILALTPEMTTQDTHL